MPRKKGHMPTNTKATKKDKFDALDADFRDQVAAMSRKDIREKIAQISIDNQELLDAKEKDTDLMKAKEQAKEAGEVYREGLKMNKLKIAFAKRVLDDKGG